MIVLSYRRTLQLQTNKNNRGAYNLKLLMNQFETQVAGARFSSSWKPSDGLDVSLNDSADTSSRGYFPVGISHALAFDLIMTHSDDNPLKDTRILSSSLAKTAGFSIFNPFAMFLSLNRFVKNSDDLTVGWSPFTLSKFLPVSSSYTSMTAIVALYCNSIRHHSGF